MLEAVNLNTLYGRAHILFDLSLTVQQGEVVVLLGRNGAGKSTTMKSIMGLTPIKSGSVRFHGEPIDRLPSYQIARHGLGYVPEDRRIFTGLTVRENLEVGRQPARTGATQSTDVQAGQGRAVDKQTPWDWDRLVELFPNLGEMPNRLGGQMSGGEQQMLSIARTLMGNPQCILLDEPSEGVAPVIVDQMASAVRMLKDEGVAILLSEQNLHFAQQVGDRAYIIEKGRIQFAGTMAELNANEQVREQYLAI